MRDIEKIPAYKYLCPECGDDYDSKAAAKLCVKNHEDERIKAAKKAEKKKHVDEWRNSIRLEAESLADIQHLLVKYAKKYMGIALKIESFPNRFGEVSNTHHAPIGKKTNWHGEDDNSKTYLGWEGTISGKMSCKSQNWNLGAIIGGNCMGEGPGWTFSCLHMGTGGFGRSFNMELYFFIDDFPKIKAKYKTFLKLQGAASRRADEVRLRDRKGCQYVNDILDSDDIVLGLTKQLGRVADAIRERKKHLQEKHAKRADRMNVVPKRFDYDEGLRADLQESFRGHSWT